MKKDTNLNSLIPVDVNSEFLENLNENLFNPFMRDLKTRKIIGAIGEKNVYSDFLVEEPTQFLEENQLQPMAVFSDENSQRVISFQSFLNTLESLGVDQGSFAEWAQSTAHNLVPPIDFDKLVNFADYYWNGDDSPDYVTIKNLSNWSIGRINQFLSSFLVLPEVETTSISFYDENVVFYVAGSVQSYVVGSKILLSDIEQNIFATEITDINFNAAQNRTEIEVLNWPDFLPYRMSNLEITRTVSSTSPREIALSAGAASLLSRMGYTFIWDASEFRYEALEEVPEGSLYIELSDYTPLSPSITLSFAPIAEYLQLERLANTDALLEFTYNKSVDTISRALFFKERIIQNAQASGVLGGTTLTLNQPISSEVNVGDKILVKIQDSRITYTVEGITLPSQITVDRPTFNWSSVDISIVSEQTVYDTYADALGVARTGDIVIDSSTGEVAVWDGASWVELAINGGLFFEGIFDTGRASVPQNDWSSNNKWAHKDLINQYDASIIQRARLPIIEFSPYIELSTASRSSKDWRYRAVDGSYFTVESSPKLFELIQVVKASGIDNFTFIDSTTIELNSTYGNLWESADDQITLTNFVQNSGNYNITNIEFSEAVNLTASGRFTTKLTVSPPVPALWDMPDGAQIHPRLTSQGDPFDPLVSHWKFEGIKDIESTSRTGALNPMLQVFSGSFSEPQYESLRGPVWQEFRVLDTSFFTFPLHSSLQDIVLFDDYQEGDIRVYVNEKRTYFGFDEFGDGTYVTSLEFDFAELGIAVGDVIRVELGEYFEADCGLASVTVKVPYGDELYNLTNYRSVKQIKTASNSHPYFRVFNSLGEEYDFASKVFDYMENSESRLNTTLFRRIEAEEDGSPVFKNYLVDEGERILFLKHLDSADTDKLHPIWREGTHFEKFVPSLNDEGEWNLADSWFFNIKNETRQSLPMTFLNRHFLSVMQGQDNDSLLGVNSYRNLSRVNYGKSGTIKHYPGSLDSLVSSLMVSFPFQDVIESQSYTTNHLYDVIKTNLTKNYKLSVLDYLTDSEPFIQSQINQIELSEKLGVLYGDSSMYVDGVGVKNWPLTPAMMGVTDPTPPEYISDMSLNVFEIHGHYGQVSKIHFSTAEKHYIYTSSHDVKQKVASSSAAFPAITGPGVVLYRIEASVPKLFISSLDSTNWVEMRIEDLYSKIILEIERRLYDVCVQYGVSIPVDLIESQDGTDSKRFFDARKSLHRLVEYKINDPYTWNYSYSTVQSHPVSGAAYKSNKGYWKALYEDVFSTPYPHLQPWKLQGYTSKPDWWDVEYADGTTRRWLPVMWSNILAGIIPIGEQAADGSISDGLALSANISYTYLPVNISSTATDDGIGSDELIPPVWDSSNTSNADVRPLFDLAAQNSVITPSIPYTFGQMGSQEYYWTKSESFVFDRILLSFINSPILTMFTLLFTSAVKRNCLYLENEILPSHRNKPFHGEDGIQAINLTQWYVNYARSVGLSDIEEHVTSFWRGWKHLLAYDFNSAVIDTSNVQVLNDIRGITDRDYGVYNKVVEDFDTLKVDCLNFSFNRVPTRLISNVAFSKDWQFTLNKIDMNGEEYISRYLPQNYPGSFFGDEFRVFEFPIVSADFSPATPARLINFTDKVLLSTKFALLAPTSFDITIDSIVYTVGLTPDENHRISVAQMLSAMNAALGNAGTARIDTGSIAVYGTTGSTTVVIDDSAAALANLGATVSAQSIRGAAFDYLVSVPGNLSAFVNIFDVCQIDGADLLDDSYLVINYRFDWQTNKTIIKLEPLDVTTHVPIGAGVTSLGELGNLKINLDITIDDIWESGDNILLSGLGLSPQGLSFDLPYITNIIGPRAVKLFINSKDQVENIASAPITSTPIPDLHIGKLERTFSVSDSDELQGVAWRKYLSDKRHLVRTYFGDSVSGIQPLVDLVLSYADYLEDQGFINDNQRLKNFNPETQRANNWNNEISSLIARAFKYRGIAQADRNEYPVVIDAANSTLTFPSLTEIRQGSAVNVLRGSGTLPTLFGDEFARRLKYYVIRTSDPLKIKLALSALNAQNGIGIDFIDGSGELNLKLASREDNAPTYTCNPYRKVISVQGIDGVLKDVHGRDSFKRSILLNKTSYAYGINGTVLDSAQIYVLRSISRNDLGKLEDSIMELGGATLSFDYYSNVLCFNNYNVLGQLIFDPFAGVNLSSFYINALLSLDSNGRPSGSGLIPHEGVTEFSFEFLTNELRRLYDSHDSLEGRPQIKQLRNSAGYPGTLSYLDNLGIDSKTQFLFWKSFVQSKGTNFTMDAFTNQPAYNERTGIDEFYAVRLACFGDAKPKNYPELKLYPDDTVADDLKLEFVPPNGGSSARDFKEVRLTDVNRWWDQPDVLEDFPASSFYFSAKAFKKIEGVIPETIAGRRIYRSNVIFDGAIITYTGLDQRQVPLVLGRDFRFINHSIIEFIFNENYNPATQVPVNIYLLTYDEASNSPLSIIDKKAKVVTDRIHVYDPARGRRYKRAQNVIDYELINDPAVYNTGEESSVTSVWSEGFVNKVWLDTRLEGYLPYFDTIITPALEDRLEMWGRMADYSEVPVYVWQKSQVPPQDREDEDVFSNVYENVGSDAAPIWQKLQNQVATYITGTTLPTDTLMFGGVVEIYVNGKFKESVNISSMTGLIIYMFNNTTFGSYVTLVKRIPEISEQQIEALDYKIEYPHTRVSKINPISGLEEFEYFYWVRASKADRTFMDINYPIFRAENDLIRVPEPYFVLQGLRTPDNGYGVVFGNIFDDDGYNLPYRYTQLIVRGIAGKAKDDNRYALRLPQDFTLRDEIQTAGERSLARTNVHWEWKLIREGQSVKIDAFLWKLLTEACVGFAIGNDRTIDFDQSKPALNRQIFDNLTNSKTIYGFGAGQIMGPTDKLFDLILSTLSDSDIDFEPIDIVSLLNNLKIDTPENKRDLLYLIYDTFSVEVVNYIFFRCLELCLAQDKEYEEVFKTSWVSLVIRNNLRPISAFTSRAISLESSDSCQL